MNIHVFPGKKIASVVVLGNKIFYIDVSKSYNISTNDLLLFFLHVYRNRYMRTILFIDLN